jgi:hypothetical protein
MILIVHFRTLSEFTMNKTLRLIEEEKRKQSENELKKQSFDNGFEPSVNNSKNSRQSMLSDQLLLIFQRETFFNILPQEVVR